VKLSIFGLGYVGTVVTACLARDGHQVIGVDTDPAKVQMINDGRSPIIEAGVEELISKGRKRGLVSATLDSRAAVLESELSMICVGTPSRPTGDLDLTAVRRVCDSIGAALAAKSEYHLVVARSTMLPGSVDGTMVPALELSSGKKAGVGFGVAINPEFLREGTAVHDFDHPPKTVIGANGNSDSDVVASLYSKLEAPLIRTSIRTAEMVKYADNVFHALKVTFANEVGALCKQLNVDGREVMEIFCQDRKLNLSATYLRPGFAFGGSCLPKDLRAINRLAQSLALELPMLNGIASSNERQIQAALHRVLETGKRRIGVLGFAFKGGTDDLRESPIVSLIEALLGKGRDIKLYDSFVSLARLVGANRRYIEEHIPHISRLMVSSVEEIVEHAEVVLIGNQSDEFPVALRRLRPDQHVIDLTPASVSPETPAQYERVSS
jgi:GDP-mannose 6-dehydrogenase